MSQDPERKRIYGSIYRLYTFDRDGECKRCHATDKKINKVGHCEACQKVLDEEAGVK